MRAPERPYLSVVAAARNDDHGLNFRRRMQIFVSALIEQCRHHRVPAELVIVEWNPPPDRPRLAEALDWPDDLTWCPVRFIQVSPELHSRYRHAEALPLYQMIAKNAGIRRAHGEFVLATNIDILFNDDLMRFFASRRLTDGALYRADRYDVDPEVPLGAPVGEVLAYCDSHLLRVYKRDGVHPLDPTGLPRFADADIGRQDSGIRLGDGWFAPEGEPGPPFRWVDESASILLDRDLPRDAVLLLDVEPGPAFNHRPIDVEMSAGDVALGRYRVSRRERLPIPIPAGAAMRRLVIRVHGDDRRNVPDDPRRLGMRAWKVDWCDAGGAQRLLASLRRGLLYPLARIRWAVSNDNVPPAPPAPALHLNACGDFTLLSRDDWFVLRGYPEFDAFAMNVDSALLWTAHYAGIEQKLFESPKRIYHIEHEIGSGWTPAGREKFYRRIADKGITWLHDKDLAAMARAMRAAGRPILFNLDDWGLGAEVLPESSVERHACP